MFELCGAAGFTDPDPFTARQLWHAAKGRDMRAWDRTEKLAAAIMAAAGQPPITGLNPYRREATGPVAPAMTQEQAESETFRQMMAYAQAQ